MHTLLADAFFRTSSVTISDGGGLIHALFVIFIIGICALLLWAAGRWVIQKLAAPAIVMIVWTGFFLLLGLIVVLNFLLSTIGHGFMAY